jgi:hypothetical protein
MCQQKVNAEGVSPRFTITISTGRTIRPVNRIRIGTATSRCGTSIRTIPTFNIATVTRPLDRTDRAQRSSYARPSPHSRGDALFLLADSIRVDRGRGKLGMP